MGNNMDSKMKIILNISIGLLLLLTVFGSSAQEHSNENETSRHILIQIPNANIVATELKSEGFDVLKNTITENSFELIVSPSEFNFL